MLNLNVLDVVNLPEKEPKELKGLIDKGNERFFTGVVSQRGSFMSLLVVDRSDGSACLTRVDITSSGDKSLETVWENSLASMVAELPMSWSRWPQSLTLGCYQPVFTPKMRLSSKTPAEMSNKEPVVLSSADSLSLVAFESIHELGFVRLNSVEMGGEECRLFITPNGGGEDRVLTVVSSSVKDWVQGVDLVRVSEMAGGNMNQEVLVETDSQNEFVYRLFTA